jgi:hypothetical protein
MRALQAAVPSPSQLTAIQSGTSTSLYLAIEDIDHSRTKTMSPQTNGICEHFHKTALNEFYRVAFRKKVYRSTRLCRQHFTAANERIKLNPTDQAIRSFEAP